MSREKNLCIFIGHEVGHDDDIIIFIDVYMPIHISLVSCQTFTMFSACTRSLFKIQPVGEGNLFLWSVV